MSIGSTLNRVADLMREKIASERFIHTFLQPALHTATTDTSDTISPLPGSPKAYPHFEPTSS